MAARLVRGIAANTPNTRPQIARAAATLDEPGECFCIDRDSMRLAIDTTGEAARDRSYLIPLPRLPDLEADSDADQRQAEATQQDAKSRWADGARMQTIGGIGRFDRRAELGVAFGHRRGTADILGFTSFLVEDRDASRHFRGVESRCGDREINPQIHHPKSGQRRDFRVASEPRRSLLIEPTAVVPQEFGRSNLEKIAEYDARGELIMLRVEIRLKFPTLVPRSQDHLVDPALTFDP